MKTRLLLGLVLWAFAFTSPLAQAQPTNLSGNKAQEAKVRDGDSDALYDLGIKYFNQNNFAEAINWLRKAADKGNAKAQFMLGVMYEYGQGVEKDYGEALKWCRKAADQNHVGAQSNLGVMFERGQGVEKDYVEAYAFYNLAAIAEKLAAENRDQLEKKMSPQQVAEGRIRTKELRALIKKPE